MERAKHSKADEINHQIGRPQLARKSRTLSTAQERSVDYLQK